MSIKKQFLKSKDTCKVTWSVDKKVADGANSITLSGSFNNWSLKENQLQKLKNGNFKLMMELPKNAEYQFRYLVDGKKWINDSAADSFVDNQISNEENCVITL